MASTPYYAIGSRLRHAASPLTAPETRMMAEEYQMERGITIRLAIQVRRRSIRMLEPISESRHGPRFSRTRLSAALPLAIIVG